MQYGTDGELRFGVSRIFQISPDQSELVRRTGSRIFVSTKGDSIIDSILFQAQRPIENYMEPAMRAVALAGLSGHNDSDIFLREGFNPSIAQGLFQHHIVTNTWLVDSTGEAYDLFLELEPYGSEDLQDPGITTTNANVIDDISDNPLIFIAGIEELSPETLQISDEVSQIGSSRNQDQEREPGGQGRVKDPSTDGRLKENREERKEQLTSPRRAQDDDLARQAGKPGRVRAPHFDFRRKENREIAAASGR